MRQLQRGHLLAVNGCFRGLQLHLVRGRPLLCSGQQRVHQLQHGDLRLRHGSFRVRVVWRWLRVCLHRPLQLRCLPVRCRTILCGWYVVFFCIHDLHVYPRVYFVKSLILCSHCSLFYKSNTGSCGFRCGCLYGVCRGPIPGGHGPKRVRPVQRGAIPSQHGIGGVPGLPRWPLPR
jgi:hypothetical protein